MLVLSVKQTDSDNLDLLVLDAMGCLPYLETVSIEFEQRYLQSLPHQLSDIKRLTRSPSLDVFQARRFPPSSSSSSRTFAKHRHP